MAYEYANRLAARGHPVTIVHFMSDADPPGRMRGLLRFSRWWLRLLRHGRLAPWMSPGPGVRVRLIPSPRPRWLPRATICLLTAWQSVEQIAPGTARTGRLFQVVYDYEFWMTAASPEREALERALTRPGVDRIATSTAVQDMLAKIGSDYVATVPCGADLDAFGVDVPIESRLPVVGFPLRTEPHKGFEDAVYVLTAVRRRCPEVELCCFGSEGVPTPPPIVPRGRLSADELRAFYNNCAVFLLPSRFEGWGLPAVEAMACGAALVTVANGGSEDFAVDNVTASVIPRGDLDALVEAIIGLITDDERRVRLARAGYDRVQELTWDRAADAMQAVLLTPQRAI